MWIQRKGVFFPIVPAIILDENKGCTCCLSVDDCSEALCCGRAPLFVTGSRLAVCVSVTEKACLSERKSCKEV